MPASSAAVAEAALLRSRVADLVVLNLAQRSNILPPRALLSSQPRSTRGAPTLTLPGAPEGTNSQPGSWRPRRPLGNGGPRGSHPLPALPPAAPEAVSGHISTVNPIRGRCPHSRTNAYLPPNSVQNSADSEENLPTAKKHSIKKGLSRGGRERSKHTQPFSPHSTQETVSKLFGRW